MNWFHDYKRCNNSTKNKLTIIVLNIQTIRLKIHCEYLVEIHNLQGLPKNWIIDDLDHFPLLAK
jgi:hypothetical protein